MSNPERKKAGANLSTTKGSSRFAPAFDLTPLMALLGYHGGISLKTERQWDAIFPLARPQPFRQEGGRPVSLSG